MTSLLTAPEIAARETARRPDGRFGTQVRPEGSLGWAVPAVGSGYDEGGRFLLGDDGECPKCHHLQQPGQPCANCDPSCAECLGPRQDHDTSLCDDCAERAAEEHDNGEDVYEDDYLYEQEAV